MAVTARKNGTTAFLAALPCGGCRQVMAEFENRQGTPITVIMQAENAQIYRCLSVDMLLPLQFSKQNLKL
jgi:cytidine deaminase